MIRVVRQLMAEAVLAMPLTINLCLGGKWIMPADPKSIFFLASILPEGIPWGIVHAGMTDFRLLATALALGATFVRVGFEDSIYYAPGRIARTNTELVRNIASLVRGIGLEVATATEARQLLGIAG